MKELVFLSNMYPKETKGFYDNLGYIQGGENITFIQNALIEGIIDNYNCEIEILNKLLVKKSGPKRVVEKDWQNGNVSGINFSYINTQLCSSKLLYRFGRKYIKKYKSQKYDGCVFLAYGLTDFNLKALRFIKKNNKNIKTGIIVPDLPELTRSGSGVLGKLKNIISDYLTNKLIKQSDSFIDLYILFSERMKEKLPCGNNFIVFEGIATDVFKNIKAERIVGGDMFTIFYGGGIHKKYGADILYDAFAGIKDERFHLVLCGTGDYVETIKSYNNPRVHYLGRVPRERLLALQLGSDVLVNPRTSKQVFSDYSFPSKNMEYLSSGVPMVGFKLGGIPDEYDPYINYPKNETAEDLRKEIFSVATSEEAKLKAERAKEFVLNNKDKKTQSKKIINGINYGYLKK